MRAAVSCNVEWPTSKFRTSGGFGALFWVAARAVRQAVSWRYFFWLLMTFNLFDAGGYFLFSGIGNFGDWAAVVAGWQPAWAWRVGLIALGTVTYFLLFVPLCLRELRPFFGERCRDSCAARASSRSHLISLPESSPAVRAR